MTSPNKHFQPDAYTPSSQSSQFVLNDYETPVHRILLSDNPSSYNTPPAPQHTQGVGTLVCSRQHIDIQTSFSLSSNIVQTETNEISAASIVIKPGPAWRVDPGNTKDRCKEKTGQTRSDPGDPAKPGIYILTYLLNFYPNFFLCSSNNQI